MGRLAPVLEESSKQLPRGPQQADLPHEGHDKGRNGDRETDDDCGGQNHAPFALRDGSR